MSKKRYLVVGGVAGGASAAARIRRLDEHADIVVFERGRDVSFSNCCLPFHLDDTVSPSEKLILMNPQVFKDQYHLDVRVYSEVTAINREAKTITVKNVQTGASSEEAYDVLVLSPGAYPVRPKSIKGIDGKNVFSVRNVVDIQALRGFMDSTKPSPVTVVGAGFIGMEVCETLVEAGYKVNLVEAADQVMRVFDYDMAQILHKELYDRGVNVCLNETVTEITEDKVKLASGRELDSQMVVMAIGVAPETQLAKDAGLELGVTGGIKVDHNFRTNDPSIYAVGDVIESRNFFTNKPCRNTMAGPAQRQARAAADSIFGRPTQHRGAIFSCVLRVFEWAAASTGLTEKACQEEGIEYITSYIIPKDRVGLMPGATEFFFKLVVEYPSGKILGAQSVSKGAADKRVDVVAALITMGANVEDLKELELCYSPAYSTAKDPAVMAAFVATNVLNHEYKQVHVSTVRSLVEEGAFIIDSREEDEYEAGHIKGAVNIPLSQFRQRLDEIPKDRPVYIHCLSSQRSYYMTRALGLLGFDNIYNIQGSFLGICMYEYFNDQVQKREPIVTNYRFKLL